MVTPSGLILSTLFYEWLGSVALYLRALDRLCDITPVAQALDPYLVPRHFQWVARIRGRGV